MTNPNRTPAGVPTGGEFATGERAENSDLATPEPADPQVAAMRAMMAALTPVQRAAVLAPEGTQPLTRDDSVRLWEDTVGDSGHAPTDDELLEYANAVLASGHPAPAPVIGFTLDRDNIAAYVDEVATKKAAELGRELRPAWREKLIDNASKRLTTFGVGNDDEIYELFDQGVKDSVEETWTRFFNPPLNFKS